MTTYVFCGDLGGLLSLGAVRRVMGAVPLITALAKRVESHYPEIAGPIILFNTGAVIAKAFQWVRPMLDPVTMEKVELHAGVPTERFLELMPAAVLPELLRRRERRDELPGDGQSVIYIDVIASSAPCPPTESPAPPPTRPQRGGYKRC